MPKCHDQRFRHVQLGHYGAESQINEKVILAMHDRQVRNGTVRSGCLRVFWYRIDGGGIFLFMNLQSWRNFMRKWINELIRPVSIIYRQPMGGG